MEHLVAKFEDNKDRLEDMGLTVSAAVVMVMKHLFTDYQNRLQNIFEEHAEELFRLASVKEALTSSEMRDRLREHEPNVVLENRVAVDILVQAVLTGQLE